MMPKIGDTINAQTALELCQNNQLGYLVTRLTHHSGDFKDWVFDGASMIPDRLFSKIFDIPKLTDIALRHDLKYAYGELGNEEERSRADEEFKDELIQEKVSKWVVYPMYWAVRMFGNGALKTDFTWGFARK